MDFKNKTALITGSGQGVGRGIALALSERGANIALVGRTLSKVESVANEIKDNGGHHYLLFHWQQTQLLKEFCQPKQYQHLAQKELELFPYQLPVLSQ